MAGLFLPGLLLLRELVPVVMVPALSAVRLLVVSVVAWVAWPPVGLVPEWVPAVPGG